MSDKIKLQARRFHHDLEHLYKKVGLRFINIPYMYVRADIVKQRCDGHGQFDLDSRWSRM